MCVGNLTIIGSDNGRRQAIIWTNAGILLFGPSGTNFSGIAIESVGNLTSLVQIMVGAKPLSEPMLEYCYLDPQEQTSVELQSKF